VTTEPPKPLDELPPEQKPEGDVRWISGYWAWDDDRNNFLWVSGVWRTPPPGKQWIGGYWKQDGDKWVWVPGFWTALAQESEASQGAAQDTTTQQVTYLPQPPAPPAVAAPAEPPAPDTFWVPGAWEWRGTTYVWRAGYWARVQPGYVWVPPHYRWTPGGYLYVAGYWDLAIARRGLLYAPVVVDPYVVGAGFVYTPAYAVPETVIVDAMFVRPCYCHYYFGDYYGVAYANLGFESCVVYSRTHYEPIFVYERWDHRAEPSWFDVRVDICLGRSAGRVPCPPRTLVQQNTIINQQITSVTNVTNVTNVNNITNNTTNITKNVTNNQMVMPASQVAAAKGIKTVALAPAARIQAQQQAQAVQQVALQRSRTETPVTGAAANQPRVAALNVPRTQPTGPIRPATSGASAGAQPQTSSASVAHASSTPPGATSATPHPQTGPTPGSASPTGTTPMARRGWPPPPGGGVHMPTRQGGPRGQPPRGQQGHPPSQPGHPQQQPPEKHPSQQQPPPGQHPPPPGQP
jgi:hypothetical protein